MSNELNTDAVLDGPADAENQPVNAEAQPDKPAEQPKESAKPVNLFELPEFRNYQRQMDQRIALLQQQAQAARQQVDQVAMANMDDYQKAQYAAQQAQSRVQELQQELERRDLLQQKFERISTVSQNTGVPIEILNQAETPDDLAVLVAKYLKSNSTKQAQEEAQAAETKARANKVDLGGGKPNTGASRYEQALDDAMKARDPVTYARLLRQGKVD